MMQASVKPVCSFGAWLRGLRNARGLPLRVVAAAAEMDQALLSNIERGKRLPTDSCAKALAKYFDIEFSEFCERLVAARIWKRFGSLDPQLAAHAAARVHEEATAYGIIKPSPKR